MATAVLTIHDAGNLMTVLEAAQTNARVRWLVEDTGDVLEGTARSIGHEDSTFLGAGEDVRDGFLRISGMWEHYLPVTKVMEMVGETTFCIDRA